MKPATLGLLLALTGTMATVLPAPAQERAAPAASATSAAGPTHRALRTHREGPLPPTDPQLWQGEAGAPPFTVVPRKGQLALYPCSTCHKVLPLNTTPRKLVAAPHPAALEHGQGRLWCLDCHLGTDRDVLHDVRGTKVDFDRSDLLCASCHSARHRDWAFGAHGKRVANWRGEAQRYACTHCHDPHLPRLAARAPQAPPPVRAGLAPMPPRVHAERGAPHEAVAKP